MPNLVTLPCAHPTVVKVTSFKSGPKVITINRANGLFIVLNKWNCAQRGKEYVREKERQRERESEKELKKKN